MSLPLLMGTQPRVSAPRKPWQSAALVLAIAWVVAACGGGTNNVASHSPTPPASQASGTPPAQGSPAASPVPVTGAFGVLISTQTASSYAVSLVGIDGKVVATSQASTPATASCASVAGALVSPPVSTSNSRGYYMDAQGVGRFPDPRSCTWSTRPPLRDASRSAAPSHAGSLDLPHLPAPSAGTAANPRS